MLDRMSSGAERTSVKRMRARWQEFARTDAMHYVATNRDSWTKEDFYSSGGSLVSDVLEWCGPALARGRMLEIGCGAGRMLTHFVGEFDGVDGADISEVMLDTARANIEHPSVRFHTISGADLDGLPSSTYDFVFSFQVFQHIPDRRAVAGYMHETSRVLRAGGMAMLQFDTRPNPVSRRVALALPDAALPRVHRRCIRRYPVPSDWPRRRAAEADLEVLDERLPDTDSHMLLLRFIASD